MDKNYMVQALRTIGNEIIRTADDIIGTDIDYLKSVDVWIQLDSQCVPGYRVTREYEPKTATPESEENNG